MFNPALFQHEVDFGWVTMSIRTLNGRIYSPEVPEAGINLNWDDGELGADR